METACQELGVAWWQGAKPAGTWNNLERVSAKATSPGQPRPLFQSPGGSSGHTSHCPVPLSQRAAPPQCWKGGRRGEQPPTTQRT